MTWLQTPWFSFQLGVLHPLKLILCPGFLDFLLACVLYSCSSSGHLATLDKQPVFFRVLESISAQPHPTLPQLQYLVLLLWPLGSSDPVWREVKSLEPSLIYCPSFLPYGDLKESRKLEFPGIDVYKVENSNIWFSAYNLYLLPAITS